VTIIRLDNKIAVVTGASQGIGRCIAIVLAKHGAQLALVARNEAQLSETERIIQAEGGTAYSIPADVSNVAGIEQIKQRIEERLGSPAILINAAGVVGPLQTVKDSDPELWVATLMTNMVAPYLMCRAFLPEMITSGWGRIINVSSAASLGAPGSMNSAYVVSKVALNRFTRHLAAELEGTGVTANLIHPGEVKTHMWEDIRDGLEKKGPEADGYREWVRWVEQTGGDPPQKAAELVLRLTTDQAVLTNGQFLWIESGLQAPLPSW
jgi:NAD(P)-dependent dehydrogenase (short-subunit alcohol dehydrogenase family)